MLTVLVILSVNDLDELLLPVMLFLTAVMIALISYFIVKAVKSGKQPAEEIEVSETAIRSKKFY